MNVLSVDVTLQCTFVRSMRLLVMKPAHILAGRGDVSHTSGVDKTSDHRSFFFLDDVLHSVMFMACRRARAR